MVFYRDQTKQGELLFTVLLRVEVTSIMTDFAGWKYFKSIYQTIKKQTNLNNNQ